MEKTSKNGSASQGERKVLTEAEFRKMIENDLTSAMHFLNAVRTDTPTLDQLTTFLYGRYQNQLHKAELESQTKIEV